MKLTIKLGFIDLWKQWKGVAKSYKFVLNSKDITVFILSNFRIYYYTLGNPLHKSLIFQTPRVYFFFFKDLLYIDKSLAETICKNRFY